MALSIGAAVAGYRLEEVLGAGGMGTVYRAADPVLPRVVALKVLHPEFCGDPTFQARFRAEADLAATLDHDSIVTVYTRGRADENRLWIAMQYVDGTDADRDTARGRMTPSRAVHIIDRVAAALDHAHRRGLVHRDVKPANFLIDRDGERVLLADFGIARALDGATRLTPGGVIVSTIAYGAPETLSLREPVDGRADVYSLGCSLYQLLTGRPPFVEHNSPAAVMAAHLSAAPPRVTECVPALPAAIDAVVARAMAKGPDLRYPTAGEFAAAAAAALKPVLTVVPAVTGARRRTVDPTVTVEVRP